MPAHPAPVRFAVAAALLLAVTSILLYRGLTADLVVVTQQFVVTLPVLDIPITLHHSSSAVSVIGSIEMLWRNHHRLLAALVFVFSVLLPIAKLACGTAICFTSLVSPLVARPLLGILELLGKWAILDVLAIALLIVMTKVGDLVQVEEQPGLYWFIAAVLASKVTIQFIRRAFEDRLRKIEVDSSSFSKATSITA